MRRTAVTGSLGWRWPSIVWQDLTMRWKRTKPGEVFVVRHGGADEGADMHAHGWVLHHKAHPDPGYGRVEEEQVLADWETCAPTCKEFKADGKPHRRRNPGWPTNPRRGRLETYCPAAGHRRNPDVPAHPDHPVEMLLAFILDDSPGSSGTVEAAKRARVRRVVRVDY